MDRSESVNDPDLDWEAIDKQVEMYEAGSRDQLALGAKMLSMAFNQGYEQCMQDQAEVASKLELMFSLPAGNA